MTKNPPSVKLPITAEQRAANLASLESVRGTMAIEGLSISPEAERLLRMECDGLITIDQAIEKLHAYYETQLS